MNENVGNLAPMDIVSREFSRREHNIDRAKIARNTLDQKILEERLVSEYNPCSDIEGNMGNSMSKFKSNEFERLLTHDFYNISVMNAAQCINRAYMSSNIYPYELKIRRWFTSLKQIGSPSVYGYAMNTQIANGQNVFITKAPKGKDVDLLHEYIIGIYGLNELRKYIPNFAFILGAFRCNPPYIEKDKSVRAMCLPNSPNMVTYVIYERIFPGVEMSKFILTCSEKEFMSVWLQILYALDLSQRQLEYNHNDLHTEIVIIRK